VPAPTRKPPRRPTSTSGLRPTRAAERTPPPAARSEASELVQGVRAGLAVFARRPDDVLRVIHARTVRHEVTELARWAARRGVPCTEVSDGELDRFAESTHHEGLCVVTQPRRWSSARELADALARTHGAVVALDRVRNPYNVGAILRSAAFFGLEGALFGAQGHRYRLPRMGVLAQDERIVLACGHAVVSLCGVNFERSGRKANQEIGRFACLRVTFVRERRRNRFIRTLKSHLQARRPIDPDEFELSA